ncbi:hypothetical protein SLEP1_g804 [Rubroshorea leprosula]|uniref:Succinyl-CoA synthetase beta chain n=1 Tax=Rubroshorea leprosula TaxID=152421 RepID=A0AAV5HL62_9ROSI|nr:hypothetical protein SLEP1_g804 [Rubroshorea leprosula]
MVYLCEKLSLVNEMYFAITLDRKTAGPLIIACRKGGTSIEDLAEKYPDMIIKVPIDVFKGITDEDAAKVVDGLALKVADRKDSIEQVKKLYELFCKCDCTLLEINPLAETSSNQLVAADAKLNFDDNAAFHQKEIFTLRDPTQEDPREVAAAKADLNYIGLDGEIGCMVNGAGLAMATMDIIKLRGGTPANFLDVGGNASEGQVVEAFKILTSDEKVKAILVNIFGGIMKCDVIASGIVNAAKQGWQFSPFPVEPHGDPYHSLLSNSSPLLLLKPSTLLLIDPSAFLLLLKSFALLLLLLKLAAKSISSAAAEAIYSTVAGSICSTVAARAICCCGRSHLLLWPEPSASNLILIGGEWGSSRGSPFLARNKDGGQNLPPIKIFTGIIVP